MDAPNGKDTAEGTPLISASRLSLGQTVAILPGQGVQSRATARCCGFDSRRVPHSPPTHNPKGTTLQLTISIDLEVSDTDVADDIITHLEHVLPHMADNVMVCSERVDPYE